MNSVLEILWIILIYIFIQRIVLIGMGIVKKAAAATHRKRTRENGLDETAVEKEEMDEPIEMVSTSCCGKDIPRKRAYQVAAEEGDMHFFCSWECRQAFVKRQSNAIKQEEEI
jgi:YHS domain-containing protein